MKTSISFLNSHYDFFKTIEKINASEADYIHVDVMDGLFVPNASLFTKEMLTCLKKSPKKKDVHLMTLHIKSYVDLFSYIDPEYITYSYEATTNHEEIIEYIKAKKYKVGIAISPTTKIESILPLINKVDLVLIMSVTPGAGGQKFQMSTINKIEDLVKVRKEYKLDFKINVDGGINDTTISYIRKNLDLVVSGSFVCKSNDYNLQIEKLKK